MIWPVNVVGQYLRFDPYGIYLWTPRFLIHLMWPLRFWAVSGQRYEVKTGTCWAKVGNRHFGPLYIAWYDRAAWER